MVIGQILILLATILAVALSCRQFLFAWRVIHQGGTFDRSDDQNAFDETEWPDVAILIPAHNEERVLAGCLKAMCALDYPVDKLSIVVIDDRSTDLTYTIAKEFAEMDKRVRVIRRPENAVPGKAAAILDGMTASKSEILVLFDADYLPPPSLLKHLVAPFADPQVGATMGRVVPANTDRGLLTRLLDLERRAGYAVDQNARELLGLAPQFGGTVGGIRRAALESVGGWPTGHLAEDTDLTFRLVLANWRVKYLNDARCYEEVPEDWVARFRQVRRWAYGHNQCLISYFGEVLRAPRLTLAQRMDGALLLLIYLFPLFVLVSIFALIPFTAFAGNGIVSRVLIWLAPVLSIAMLAPYSQIMVAAVCDRQPHVLRALPLLFISSCVSLLAASAGVILLARNLSMGLAPGWDKTRRYRTT